MLNKFNSHSQCKTNNEGGVGDYATIHITPEPEFNNKLLCITGEVKKPDQIPTTLTLPLDVFEYKQVKCAAFQDFESKRSNPAVNSTYWFKVKEAKGNTTLPQIIPVPAFL